MEKINPKIFKAYDIRGIYPTEINEGVISRLAKGIFTFFVNKLKLSRAPRLVLSYDGRISTPSLVKEVRKALLESGAEVVDIGMATTPTFYFAVYHYPFDAGLQISASHNPKEYNGIKFVMNSANGLTKIGKDTGMNEVREITLAEKFVSLKSPGKLIKKENVVKDQVKNAMGLVGNPKIKRFKIVADAANAVGALYLDALFKEVPCELIKMNFEINGNFPAHQPDPLQFDNLKDLQKKVSEEKADLGIAHDGDGYRLLFINEKGKVIQASLITALVAQELLKVYPGEKVVCDVRNTLNVESAVKKSGGEVVLTRVGHALITETTKKSKALFAGENSGHYFFRQTGYAEDPMPVILTVLSAMTREEKTISEVLKPLMVSFESGEINFKTENAKKIETLAKEKYKDGKISTLDGLIVEYPTWRFNIRLSNTEPLLRLNVESFNKKIMEEKRDELSNLTKRMIKSLKL